MAIVLEKLSFWLYWLIFFGIILLRYLVIAGGAHFLFYHLLRKSILKKQIHLESNSVLWKSIQRDIQLSIISTGVFAFGAALLMLAYNSGLTQLYTSIKFSEIWYLGFSFVGVLIIQDTYFYFTHRFFHHPYLFKWVHQSHHLSRKPTPWTSFAFDPPEALIQVIFLLGIVFIIPLHVFVLAAIVILMTLWALFNHLGFKLFPFILPCHWLGRWFIGPAHHLLHHRKYKVHYGLYFTFWDKLLGSSDAEYEQEFENYTKKASA